jgi:signal transduction histidine kinase
VFHSATLKLTGWYLLILMVISIVFSLSIFETTTQEVSIRLEHFQKNIQVTSSYSSDQTTQPLEELRADQTDKATANIIAGLVIANIVILIIGGGLSYLLARHTLRPIKDIHEAQSRFTSDASHELRTPLAAMKTEIEVALRDKDSTKHDLADVLRSNLEEVDKLSNLSQMLLDLSRLDHDKLKVTAVNLVLLTHNVIKQYKVGTARIAIKAHKKFIAVGNEAAISELVSILIDNALKYSPINSLILISISQQNDYISFQIINTGDGIEETKLPYIFDRFYRADSSRTNRVGYGLGLSLAKKIVELSNGELSVTSTPGQSTIFTVLLPVFQSASNQK